MVSVYVTENEAQSLNCHYRRPFVYVSPIDFFLCVMYGIKRWKYSEYGLSDSLDKWKDFEYQITQVEGLEVGLFFIIDCIDFVIAYIGIIT